MEVFLNDIFDVVGIEKNQININVVKAIVYALKEKGLCIQDKQRLNIDRDTLEYCWNIYAQLLLHFDPNYNRRTDFLILFRYILSEKLEKNCINFNSLFCTGYTRYGYKNRLGHTTIWKLEELYNIRNLLERNGISNTFRNYYSDVFLENCDSTLEPRWREQLEYNRELFRKEGEKYFDKSEVLDASSIPIFSNDDSIPGFIDDGIINSTKLTTYSAFVKSNKKFYESLGFTEEQMKIRNDRLITMYRLLSDYYNSLSNVIFLPMENMYERENIFSENGTCTMYLSLKWECENEQ